LSRILLAFKAFFGILFSGRLSDSVALSLGLSRRAASVSTPPPKKEPAAPAAALPADGAVQVLAMLQSEARLVDFLLDDVSPYTDEQVGSVVRDVHSKARSVLDRYVKLVPVVDGVEGAVTQISALGLNPKKHADRLRIIGNVPPDGKVEAGILRHRGWKVESVDLPALKPGEKAVIIAPAEIEVE
jgi:hypothetical protein